MISVHIMNYLWECFLCVILVYGIVCHLLACPDFGYGLASVLAKF